MALDDLEKALVDALGKAGTQVGEKLDAFSATVGKAASDSTGTLKDVGHELKTLSTMIGEVGKKPIDVNVVRTEPGQDPTHTLDKVFDVLKSVHFDRYEAFIKSIFFPDTINEKPTIGQWRTRLEMDPYEALERATDLFLRAELGSDVKPDLALCHPAIDEAGRRAQRDAFISGPKGLSASGKVPDAFAKLVLAAFGNLAPKAYPEEDSYGIEAVGSTRRILCDLLHPFFADIGGIRQAERVLLLRYQNQRVVGARGEALTQLNIESTDSLNAWLQGRLEAHQQRRVTTLQERASEYFAQVGANVLPEGSEVNPAEVRVGLMPALFGFIRSVLAYSDAEDNKMISPDPTPVLHALKQLQLEADVAEANRAFDMPFKLRKELLVSTAILRHPTLVRTLVQRTQVRRAAEYQSVVEALKSALGWTIPDIAHYQDLAYSAEVLIAVGQVYVWARADDGLRQLSGVAASKLRHDAKAFSNAFRAVAGVDLGARDGQIVVAPSVLRVPTMSVGGRNGARPPDGSARRAPAVAPEGLSRRA